MIYLTLFVEFFKVGLFTIGGGLAALPLLREQAVGGGWVTSKEFMDMIAVSQSTPGPIGINLATFAGFKAASFGGAFCATAGMVAPSLIIIMLIAACIKDFNERPLVRRAMRGFRATAVGLVASAVFFIFSSAVFDIAGFLSKADYAPSAPAIILFVASAALYYKWRLHPAIYICGGAVAGILFF